MNYNFDIEFAIKHGVNESIMINNFIYWIKKNKANNTNFNDGNWWTYNSARAFKELFPFWSEKQIRTILKSLEDKGILISGNYNQLAYDRTKWYAISKDFFWLIDVTKWENGNDNIVTPIPNKNTDTINYEAFSNLWNEFATKNNKAKIAKLTDSRKKKIALRQKEYRNLLEIFTYVLKKSESSDFLLNGNFYTFDWLMENDTNILKVYEGKYDNEKPKEIII